MTVGGGAGQAVREIASLRFAIPLRGSLRGGNAAVAISCFAWEGCPAFVDGCLQDMREVASLALARAVGGGGVGSGGRIVSPTYAVLMVFEGFRLRSYPPRASLRGAPAPWQSPSLLWKDVAPFVYGTWPEVREIASLRSQ